MTDNISAAAAAAYRGKTVVVKYGGNAIADPELQLSLIHIYKVCKRRTRTMKLWAGRFQKQTDEKVNDFNSSLAFEMCIRDRCRAKQNSAEQSRTVQSGAAQSGAEQNRMVQSGAERSGAEQNGAEQSRTVQSGVEQRSAEQCSAG